MELITAIAILGLLGLIAVVAGAESRDAFTTARISWEHHS